jgi:hypothetical protein
MEGSFMTAQVTMSRIPSAKDSKWTDSQTTRTRDNMMAMKFTWQEFKKD